MTAAACAAPGARRGDGAPPVIEVRGLHKSYAGVPAVRGVDLTVAEGETFGFLGPNGAGKTTTVGSLCTLVRPSAGSVRVAGHDAVTEPDAVRRAIGLVFQQQTVDGDLTATENLRFHADLYAVPRDVARTRITMLLELVGLSHRAGDLVRTFSGGMARRLEIARALVHTPRVLFLDEPTLGLDPHARAGTWEHLRAVREHSTLFLTTHYLDEAEQCDRIAIIDGGRIVVAGTPSELKSALGADRVTLRTTDDAAAATTVASRFGLPATAGRDGVQVRVRDGAASVPRLCAALDLGITAVTVSRPSLDDVFLHHTGRRIEPEKT